MKDKRQTTEVTHIISAGGRGSGKMVDMTNQFPELKKIRDEQPPNYRRVACCASCDCFKDRPPLETIFLVGFSWCTKYQTTVLPSGLCEGYEED